MTTQEINIAIKSYKNDIAKLNKMKALYEETENLTGGLYADFIEELNTQIAHCEECIENLKESVQEFELEVLDHLRHTSFYVESVDFKDVDIQLVEARILELQDDWSDLSKEDDLLEEIAFRPSLNHEETPKDVACRFIECVIEDDMFVKIGLS